MIVAIASGKGGTGKTTVAANLINSLSGMNIQAVDCDVEEPNLHLFLEPEITYKRESTVLVPEIDKEKCSFCGKCSEVCSFNALTVLKTDVLVFPELCHSCGACSSLCPEGAIKEIKRSIGQVERGKTGKVPFIHGIINPGEAFVPPLIRDLKKEIDRTKDVIIDAPPGTSCPVVETIDDCDFVLLVTEPTPFGLNDLRLAVEMCKKLNLPAGIVVNRWGIGNADVIDYANEEGIPVLLKIPFSEDFARLYARGQLITDEYPEWKERFSCLWADIRRAVEE